VNQITIARKDLRFKKVQKRGCGGGGERVLERDMPITARLKGGKQGGGVGGNKKSNIYIFRLKPKIIITINSITIILIYCGS